MVASVAWLVENRIVLTSIKDTVTIEELQQMGGEIENYLNSGQAPVHLIFDLSLAQARPIKINEISKVSSFLKHPNLGFHAMVSPNRLINFLGTMVHHMMGSNQAYIAETIEDALNRLQRMDESLKNQV